MAAVKASPSSFGVSSGLHLLGSYNFSISSSSCGYTYSVNVSTAAIPNWNTLTNDNFITKFSNTYVKSDTNDGTTGSTCSSSSHSYNATTGTLTATYSISSTGSSYKNLYGSGTLYVYAIY